MALTKEWKLRIENWINALPRLFYKELGKILFEGFTTRELLTIDDIKDRAFKPMPEGTAWGAKWEYGWFRGNIILPESSENQMIVIKPDIGAESAVYINGEYAGAIDEYHRTVLLTKNAVPNDIYEIILEGYAGHGPRVCHAGPVEPGRETVPEPPETQAVVKKSTYGIWNEEVYQLYIDIKTLYEIRNSIDKDSLRVAEIDEALRKFTLTVDFELPFEEFMITVKKCRESLKPLLSCVNGSTVPEMFMFGHSHIDCAWLWPLAETEKKCVRTFSTQLSLMEQYPEYKFLQSQAYLYYVIKSKYPSLYEKIKTYVRKGQFIPDGAMWVEPDTNISGGESLIRQFIHGKRFFYEEFGIDSRLCWLPDVFGYSGAFPQIMKGCEVDYFSTQKIFWTYNSDSLFPYHTFWWEGIDGTRILAHIHNDYNSHTNPGEIIKRWNERVQKDGISTRLFPFGYGDGGGGPTRDHLEYTRRCRNLEGVPKCRICAPVDFFTDLEKRGVPDVHYVGELYFQAHRGTYTSQARTKKGNRKCEFLLREAEIWGTLANTANGYPFGNMTLDQDWKTILTNQFHDILPGSSIKRVYEEAEADYKKVTENTGRIIKDAAETFADKNEAITVFNSLSWNSKKLVEVPFSTAFCRDEDGNILPVQSEPFGKFVEVDVPAMGYNTIYPCSETADIQNTVRATERSLENEYIRVIFNDNGEITSILDKESGRELAGDTCNVFKMYKDVPNLFDAWDIDSNYANMPVSLESRCDMEVIAQGPLFAALRIKKRLSNSDLEQEIILRKDSRQIDFRTKIDWQESHKLLKVCFPVSVHANEAIHEIQFGHIRRPNHYSTDFDQARFEVCHHKWVALCEGNHGVAILNDCKYGVNVLFNSINLTLLKSAMAPDMTADRGLHEFTYSLYIWEGSFADSEVVKKGYELNCPLITVYGSAGKASFLTIDKPNIVIETVKPAEDGSGDIIVRLYESMHMSVTCMLRASFPVSEAYQTNMLEKKQSVLEVSNNKTELRFRPFEIKTIRLVKG